MAAGMIGSLVVNDTLFQAGVFDELAQNVQVFNGASQNTIRLVNQSTLGYYKKDAFFNNLTTPISRRNLASVGDATPQGVVQDEMVEVKLFRSFGPIAEAVGAIKEIGMTSDELSYKLGQKYAAEKMKDMVNTGLIALGAAIGSQTTVLNYTANATLTHTHLVSGLKLFGDAADRIKCWVMHSKQYFDLVGQALSDKITNVADVVIVQGTVGTLGRPVIVTDSAALWDTNSTGASDDRYTVLGLPVDALVVTESGADTVLAELVTGKDQILWQMQAEYEYLVQCKGIAWKTGTGGANPTNAALGTTTNWEAVYGDAKSLAGVAVITK